MERLEGWKPNCWFVRNGLLGGDIAVALFVISENTALVPPPCPEALLLEKRPGYS